MKDATSKQNSDFCDAMYGKYLLDKVLEWVQSNMNVDDVFQEVQLREWAEDNGFVEPTDDR